MIYSIHIPKTAGTSFRYALKERYGTRLAVYYGARDPKTTECLRVPRRRLLAAVAELPDRGFEILHGHYTYDLIAPLAQDPSKIWTWLRDPVERTISHYEFYRKRPLEEKALAQSVRAGELTLPDFLKVSEIVDLQTRHLKGVPLSEIGFVGISEHFELGLRLLFGEDAPDLNFRYNATERDAPATKAQRNAIARANIRDMQLYGEGLRLFVESVASWNGVAAAGSTPGLVKRLIRAVR